uniref:Aminopeptidase n=1 Tax=Hirondellea gigas TaxID=1518452 RepID=A0A6A7FYW6_9CRUS
MELNRIVIGIFLICQMTSVAAKENNGRNRSSNNRLRLPTQVQPINYKIKLQPYVGINNTVDGHVEIEIRALRAISRIRLHMTKIFIKPRGIKLISTDNSESIAIRGTKKEPRRDFITIRLRDRLVASSTYTLIIDFTSKLNYEPKGFYTSTYWEQDDRQRYVAATQFWPALARNSFPCFDEPALKATFDVFLARQEHMTALSNMPLLESTPIPQQPGWYWDQFATTVPMSTYLVAFLITEFLNRTLEGNEGSRVTAWTRGEILDQTQHSLDVCERGINYFEEYFGIELSIPKIDMVGLPLTAHNAMENWGLITFSESSFVYSTSESTAASKQESAELVTHEVAHQWFGNLVSITWWTDLWLSEGFSTYMSNVAIDKMFPSWQVLDQFVVTRLQTVMAVDSLLNSHPVSTTVQDPAKIHEVFDEIPYSKGASIIRMMSHILSESTLREGLSNYLDRFKFKNAAQDDLWETLTVTALKSGSLPHGMTVKEIMDTWTLQPGYPVITIERPDNYTATIKQTRFYLSMLENNGNNGISEEDLRWYIPITFTDQNYPYFVHTKPRTWLRPQDDQLTVTGLPSRDKWAIFNLQQTGYFRVNYDSANWELLIEQLLRDHTVFPESNRAQIIDDSLNLARAGILSYTVALNVTKYLYREEAYTPWLAALNNLRYIDVMLRSTPQYGAFQDYLRWLVEPIISRVGLEENKEDPLVQQLLRMLLDEWACKLEHPACLAMADDLLKRFSNKSTLTLDGNVGGAYCVAVQRGGREAWLAVWKLFRQTPNTVRRDALGQALGCTTYAWLINMQLQSDLQGMDLVDALRWIRQTELGRYIAWFYVWNNRRTLIRRPQIFPTIIQTVAKDFYNDHHRFMLSAILEQVDPETGRLLSGVTATVASNQKWHLRSYSVIQLWLAETGFSIQIDLH